MDRDIAGRTGLVAAAGGVPGAGIAGDGTETPAATIREGARVSNRTSCMPPIQPTSLMTIRGA